MVAIKFGVGADGGVPKMDGDFLCSMLFRAEPPASQVTFVAQAAIRTGSYKTGQSLAARR